MLFLEFGTSLTRLLQYFSFHFLHISPISGVPKNQSHSKSRIPSFSHSVKKWRTIYEWRIGKHINEGNSCLIYYSEDCMNRMCATRKAVGTTVQNWYLNLRPHKCKAQLLAIRLWHCVHVGVCVCVRGANVLQYPTSWLLWSNRIR